MTGGLSRTSSKTSIIFIIAVRKPAGFLRAMPCGDQLITSNDGAMTFQRRQSVLNPMKICVLSQYWGFYLT